MTDYNDLRFFEKRIEINRRVGIHQKNPYSGFTKAALNSIHRYLTGEFVSKPQLLHTGMSPSRDQMREQVAVAVVELIGECSITDWFVRYDHLDRIDTQFKTAELSDILEAMDVARENREDVEEASNLENFE